MAKFAWEHLIASSSWNPPPAMTILSTGALARSLSDEKSARSALFSSRATQLYLDLGSGTEPSSIVLRMGAWPRERFFLVAHLIDVSFYLLNVTSIRWKSFPEARTAFKNLSLGSLNVLQSVGLPSAITSAWPSTTASISLRWAWPEDVPYPYSKVPSWPIYFQYAADYWHRTWQGELQLVHDWGFESNLPFYKLQANKGVSVGFDGRTLFSVVLFDHLKG